MSEKNDEKEGTRTVEMPAMDLNELRTLSSIPPAPVPARRNQNLIETLPPPPETPPDEAA